MDHPRSRTRRNRKLRPRFYVPASRFRHAPGAAPELMMDRDSAHHMRSVLRLSQGAKVALFDNSGREYEAEVIECKPSRVRVRVIRAATPQVESPLKVTLAQALLKGNSFDKLITLCTELGVSRLIPLFTARTVVKLSRHDAAERVSRWERIVREAAAQSGRVKAPVVELPLTLQEFLEQGREGVKIIVYERGGSGQLRQIFEDKKAKAVTLLAGPEGGFEQAEVNLALESGFQVWGLGPRILRAENAGAIAISLLEYHCGDMG